MAAVRLPWASPWFPPVTAEGNMLPSSTGVTGDRSSPSGAEDRAEASCASVSPVKASKTQEELHRELLLAHRR